MIIKRILSLFSLLLLLCGAWAQRQPSADVSCAPVPDIRSCIAPFSRGPFTVSPTGGIWLCSNYQLWHTQGMSSCWSRMPRANRKGVEFNFVVCPDTAVVLIFGKIFDPSDPDSNYDKYIRSTDGGQHWTYLTLPEKMDERQKMDVLGRRGGQIWLSIGQNLYYSPDEALHFQKIASFPEGEYKYDMDNNGQYGIAKRNWRDSTGLSRNSLLITRDNWKSYKAAPSPVDQLPEIKNRKGNYFYKYAMCRSLIVMEQADRCFWTSIDTLLWREIPFAIRDFAVDRESDEWVLVTRENLLLRSADMHTFDTVNTHGPCHLTDIKYAGKQAIYGYSYNEWKMRGLQEDIDSLYRFDADGQTVCGLFSENIPIHSSHIDYPVLHSDLPGKWELTTGNDRFTLGSNQDLIRYDSHNDLWYRFLRTPFNIWDVQLCADGLKRNLLVSDGARQYLVPIDNPSMTLFHYKRPLDDFLKSPVKTVKVAVKFHSCTNGNYDEYVLYTREGNDFVAKKIAPKDKYTDFPDPFPVKALRRQMDEFNRCYDPEVRAADFKFTDADYDSLRRYVFQDPYSDFTVLCDSTTKERVLGLLPRLDDNAWNAIIKSGWPGGCTTFGEFEVTMENEAGEALVVSCTADACHDGFFPYMTPFRAQCGKYDFPSTDLSFMRFIGKIMPSNMMYRREFSNFSLLMKAYRYVIWHRESFGI